MTDVHSAKQRSFNMSRIRGKNTVPEKIVRSLLRAKGFRYRLNVSRLAGKPDIVIGSCRTAVFVHGCFWHRHKNCSKTTNPKTNPIFWQQKFMRTVQRDRENVKALREANWKVVVIWECQVRRKPQQVARRLEKALMTCGHKS